MVVAMAVAVFFVSIAAVAFTWLASPASPGPSSVVAAGAVAVVAEEEAVAKVVPSTPSSPMVSTSPLLASLMPLPLPLSSPLPLPTLSSSSSSSSSLSVVVFAADAGMVVATVGAAVPVSPWPVSPVLTSLPLLL